MTAALIFLIPELFDSLHIYSFDWVKTLIERDSEVHVLNPGEYVDTQLGGLLIKGAVQVAPVSDDDRAKLLSPENLMKDEKEEDEASFVSTPTT